MVYVNLSCDAAQAFTHVGRDPSATVQPTHIFHHRGRLDDPSTDKLSDLFSILQQRRSNIEKGGEWPCESKLLAMQENEGSPLTFLIFTFAQGREAENDATIWHS